MTDDERTRTEYAAEAALSLREVCGEASKSRQAVLRIGKALIAKPFPCILVPVCLDYGNLNGQVPPMALRHLEHYERCREVLGEATAIFLMPDLESEDPSLRSNAKTSQACFAGLLAASRHALEQTVQARGVCVADMSCMIPNLAERERKTREWIRDVPSFAIRIQNDTIHRSELYNRTMGTASHEQRVERTIRTAAQYVMLGRYAVETRCLVMNHTTTNLAWYGKTDVGLLHNPVKLTEV